MDPNQVTQNNAPSTEPIAEPSAEAVLRDIAELRAELSASDKAPVAVPESSTTPPPAPKTELARPPEVVPLPAPAPELPKAPEVAPPPLPKPNLPKRPEIAPLPPTIELPKATERIGSLSANIPQSTIIPQPEKLLTPPPLARQQGTPWGAVIGIVIIIVILIVGALYFWGAKLAREDAQTLPPVDDDSTETQLQEEIPAGSADETAVFPEVTDEMTAFPDTSEEETTPADSADEEALFLEMTDDGFVPETDTEATQ